MNTIEQRLRDLWYSNVTTNAICSSYRLYKEVYGLEDYLANLTKTNHIYLSQIRTVNHPFLITTVRQRAVRRKEHYCRMCDNGQVGDE